MLERIEDAPAQAIALRASGTIMGRDIEEAIDAAIGQSDAATGLVVVLNSDFDGYFAELARGLANAALAHKGLVKLAVVASPSVMGEAGRAPSRPLRFLCGCSRRRIGMPPWNGRPPRGGESSRVSARRKP